MNWYQSLLYGSEWLERRREIIHRDNFTCQKCGVKMPNDLFLQVHHKGYVPLTKPWDYPENTLETLCVQCHQRIHEEDKIRTFNSTQALSYYLQAFQTQCDIPEVEMQEKWSIYKKQWNAYLAQEHPWIEVHHPIRGGTLLSIAEYRYFQEHNFPLDEIKAYSWSGKRAYEVMKDWRLKENCEYDLYSDSVWERRPLVQSYNYYYPGFYKIIYFFGDCIGAFYSAIETNEFVPEEICLPKHSLANSTQCNILLGDIILIKRCVLKGSRYVVDWVNWTFEKERQELKQDLAKYRRWYNKSVDSNAQWEIEHIAGVDKGMETEQPYPHEAIDWLSQEIKSTENKIFHLIQKYYL